MVNSMVQRATSDLLMGPDWAINVEICDILNHDPGQARSVFKGIKKRLGSKNPKVQLLTLTLLETLVQSCGGDIVHMHVAERDILHDMVKIVKNKPDFLVKEKILVLIDTWQKAFGGPRFSQYYAAHQEHLRYGAVFRTEGSAPVFTSPQIHPFSPYQPNVHNYQQGAVEPEETEYPTLSLTEIENARGVMNVLEQMLNAIDSEDNNGIKEEVIVDLVEQCRNYKQSILHLVSSTRDETLLHQGLAVNDDLQRVLAKHQSMASGTENAKPEPCGALIDIDTGEAERSASTAGTSTALDPNMDLLSFDSLTSPTIHEPSLGLVPVGGQPSTATPNDHNALVIFDMFSDTTNPPAHPVNADHGVDLNEQSDPSTTAPGPSPFDQPLYPQNPGPAWNHHIAPHQPPSPNGSETSSLLPPPPWAESSQEIVPEHSPGAMHPQTSPQAWSEQQPTNLYMMPQHLVVPASQYSQPNQMMQGGPYMMGPGAQMPYMYVHPVYGGQGSAAAYGYGEAGPQYLDQRVHGLSVRDDSGIPMRGSNSKPEDKLFGDLVDMAKVKPSTTSRDRFGSM